ncbi:hypothetical protein Rs2_47921 [Raphanus sativus]|nr:hypothetical protein Rs2_47921 [Raphanus sativus]
MVVVPIWSSRPSSASGELMGVDMVLFDEKVSVLRSPPVRSHLPRLCRIHQLSGIESLSRCTLQWEAITRRLTNNSKVYSCGSSLSGVLAHGPETNLCVAFTSIEFPFSAQVAQVSATQNHSSFVLQSGEVLTCRDNSLHFCGHLYTSRPIFRPKFVEALKGTPYKQVAAGLHLTVFLSREGHVFTCGSNTHGHLGHDNTLDSPVPKAVEFFKALALWSKLQRDRTMF